MIEEKAKNYMMEAANLADELRSEQENSSKAEASRKETEAKIRELQIKVDDEEINAIKWGEKMIIKLTDRMKDVETELEMERRRYGDSNKCLRKTQRGIHEYSIRTEENSKNAERMQARMNKFLNLTLITFHCRI